MAITPLRGLDAVARFAARARRRTGSTPDGVEASKNDPENPLRLRPAGSPPEGDDDDDASVPPATETLQPMTEIAPQQQHAAVAC